MGYNYEMIKKNILVTGSSGHIASNFIQQCENKFNIFNITRSENKKKLLIKKFKKSFFFTTKKIPKKLEKINFEALIFFAGPNDVSCNLKKEKILRDFFNLSFDMIESFNKFSIRKVIYVSTAQIYDLRAIVSEKNYANPQSYYGLSRLMIENLFLYYYDKINIPLVILRPSNIVGDAKFNLNNSKRLLPNQLCDFLIKNDEFKLKSSGKSIKNFISVNDIVNSLSFLIKKKITKKLSIFNLGNQNMSVIKFSKLIANIFSQKIGNIKNIKKGPDEIYLNKMIYIDNKIKKYGFKKRENLKKIILEMYNGRAR